MPGPETLAVFAVAVVFFAVVPGPAVLYIVTRSIDQGRFAGLASAVGIATGNLIHVAAATLGLSALLASSAIAFSVVKYLGAAYLIYLGVRKLLERHDEAEGTATSTRSFRRLYGEGVVVATLNPKTALFFLAFLPQFVVPSEGSPASQIAVLGVVLVTITAVSDGLYGLLSGAAAGWLRGNHRLVRRRRLFTGTVYIGLGVSAAFAGSRPNSK